MPKIDLDAIPQNNRTGYPPVYAGEVQERWVRRMTPVLGLTDFGVSHVTLKPGAWSSQRHWHAEEDEFVVMLEGEAVLIDDHGRTPMRPGDMAVFPKNDSNGHHLVNESDAECMFVAIGRTTKGDCHYPDIDLRVFAGNPAFLRKDGTRFPD
ncbi:MAG TPA: cupin domain-containing protein [Sphingobium sp.]